MKSLQTNKLMTACEGLCDKIDKLLSIFEVNTVTPPLKVLLFKRPTI